MKHQIKIFDSPSRIDGRQWDDLASTQDLASPFLRHSYLSALHESGSAVAKTGWMPQFVTVWQGDRLSAACPLYLKSHSYGEYVFDWAWADAYRQHGLRYYPKAVGAVPFTPVPGARLLARDPAARRALLEALLELCKKHSVSSMHLLFLNGTDANACAEHGLLLRHGVQFHFRNEGYCGFEAFLATLSHDKRKKIRQERRKVADAGVKFRRVRGTDIGDEDWNFFYRCYERTYLEHGNAPYLTRDFFRRVAQTMPECWLLFIAEIDGAPIATSLIALQEHATSPGAGFGTETRDRIAYGRYWGALRRVDCLHFEACYYQPLNWCIEHGFTRFEGGAQGEHKMARALMPVKTTSAHWLAHPAFADAVERFLEREQTGIEHYLEELGERTPFRRTQPSM